MALIYVDGWDAYNTGDVPKRWIVTKASGDYTVNATGGRNGTGCLKIGNFIGTNYVFRSMSATGITGTWFCGFAINLSVLPSPGNNFQIAYFQDSGLNNQIYLAVEASGAISIYNNSNTLLGTYAANINTGIWYYLELKGKITTSTATNDVLLNLNGTQVIAVASGSNASPNGSIHNLGAVALGVSGSINSNFVNFDDFYFCDSTTSINNTFLGDVRIECIHPTGAGTYTGFTPDSGSNYARVNETAEDGDTSYVASSTVTTKDTYAFADLASTPTNVFALQLCTTARKDDAGARGIATQLRVSSTDFTSSNTFFLADGYTTNCDIWNMNPNTGVAWTGSDVNALEAGFKLTN